MDVTKEKEGFIVSKLDVWLFTGMLIWVSLLAATPVSWLVFVRQLLALALPQLPVFVFAWYRTYLRERWSLQQYLFSWAGVFVVGLPLLTASCMYMQVLGVSDQLFAIGALYCISLELVLVVNAWYRRQVRQVPWIGRISLDKAVLISLLMIAVILSAMAVSSLNNPQYHTKDQLLIGYEFIPAKIIAHFGLFLFFIAQFLFMYMCGYALYYLNSRWLVARVLKQRGIMAYVMSAFALIAILYPLMGQLLAWMPINRLLGSIFSENPFVLENAFAALMIVFATLPVVLAIQWTRQNNRIVSLEQEKTRTELDLLKQQLNPHFFFNTLNNLYALSLQQSKQTPDSILQLSELMRYVIYKGQETRVSIREEVKYLEDYMDLQQIRLRKSLDLQFQPDIEDPAQQIAPMLLIVFIENAFKHGIEPAEDAAFLHLTLHCKQQRLYFSCENSFEGDVATAGGIGLSNLQKRLELLYPGRYQLQTGVKNHTFKAEMQLDLS
ncbi:sensor histidine kinase [Chitinophaga pinensis]|nr:sensor histidine kinase [Chitinophaga pinensis]